MIMFFVPFYALLGTVLLATGTFGDGDLKQVNLIYRHGDRSPVVIFPTDPNKIDKWPQGLGWLSQTGMRQQYGLGQWLRNRYVNSFGLLSPHYKRVELTVHSSDENRCLMSASSNLAGLYPPSQNETFNPKIIWQPIPVHTQPGDTDNMLHLGANCPRYDQLLAETMKSDLVAKEEKRNKEFYKFVEEKSGMANMNISNIWKIADTVFCERRHNLTLAPWVNETIFNKLRQLESLQFHLLYYSQQMRRLEGGPLLNQFIQNMQAYTANTTASLPKMYMYSGHDTTVAALLSALDLFPDKSPAYASCVLVELHQDPTGQYFINIFYKNDTYNDSAVPLVLKDCSFNCPLDKFVKLTKAVVPTDWNKECGNNPSGSPSGSILSTAWIVAIVLGSLLLLIVVMMLIFFIRQWRKSDGSTLYGKFDVTA